jgi:hypothetical protein
VRLGCVLQEGHDPEGLFPCILGHEAGAIVESVGPGVTSVAAGDHIVPAYTPQCGEPDCIFCQSPKTNLCPKIRATQGQGVMPDGTSRFTSVRTGETLYHFMGCSTMAEYTVLAEISCAKVTPVSSVITWCCGRRGKTAAAPLPDQDMLRLAVRSCRSPWLSRGTRCGVALVAGGTAGEGVPVRLRRRHGLGGGVELGAGGGGRHRRGLRPRRGGAGGHPGRAGGGGAAAVAFLVAAELFLLWLRFTYVAPFLVKKYRDAAAAARPAALSPWM